MQHEGPQISFGCRDFSTRSSVTAVYYMCAGSLQCPFLIVTRIQDAAESLESSKREAESARFAADAAKQAEQVASGVFFECCNYHAAICQQVVSEAFGHSAEGSGTHVV